MPLSAPADSSAAPERVELRRRRWKWAILFALCLPLFLAIDVPSEHERVYFEDCGDEFGDALALIRAKVGPERVPIVEVRLPDRYL